MKTLKLTLLVCVAAFSSCTVPKYVNVPVNYNPKFYFNPDSTTIVAINRFDPMSSKVTNKKTLGVLKAGGYAAIKYAQDQLMQLPKVRVINLVDSAAFAVNTDSISAIAAKYKAHYVLALTDFSANIGLDGVENKTAYYNTNTTVNFTMFESNGIYYKKLKGAATDPQSEQEYPGLVLSLFIHPTVKGNKADITASAQHATQNALQDYFPYTIAHDRPLYSDDYFKEPVAAILEGNFNKADSLLQPMVKHANNQIASKAAYNLAVVYEAIGDIDAAIDMAQLSITKFDNKYAVSILGDLKLE